MGDFSSCVTLSMKFDCRRVRLMVLMERVRYITTPNSTKASDVVPTERSAQYSPAVSSLCSAPKIVSRIQPTSSATSSTSITTPRVMGSRRERRSNMPLSSVMGHVAARQTPESLSIYRARGENGPMKILGIGTDIIECLRIAAMIEKHGELFLTRVY